MPITSIVTQQTGTVGVTPSIVYISTTDTESEILTAGYLNNAVQLGTSFPLPCLAEVTTVASLGAPPLTGWYQVVHSGGNWSLTSTSSPGDVTLPTIANHLIVSSDANGTLANRTGTAINNGSLQAGLSGTAGTLISYPATPLKGSLAVAAVANSGNTVTTISNDAMAQASVVSIPDPGNAAGQFLIGATATPFISGNFPKNSGTAGLMVDSGLAVSSIATTSTAVLLSPSADQTITAHSLDVAQGNVSAGSSGHQGVIYAFPSGSSAGRLGLSAIGNTGNTDVLISNAIFGQASTITIPDPGAATANFLLNTGGNAMAAGSSITLAKVNGTEAANAVTASGVAGLLTTSALTTAGGASYAITWTNTFISATSIVLLTIAGGTNTTENITLKCAPGSGTATLTIYNNTAATALNGTILISYLVM